MNKFRLYLNRVILVILVSTVLLFDLSPLLVIVIMLVVALQLLADELFKVRIAHGN